MAFDAFYLSAVLGELETAAAGARVEKIHQPSRDTVILHLKCADSRQKLLFGVSPTAPRLHLTTSSPENPPEPPMFCMLLRKHLSGARLANISQIPMERCAEFTFDCIDEMGDPVQKKLVAELMGRTCNIYLLDPTGRILDCLRRIGLDETAKRPALPGMYYQMPDPITKQDPAAYEDFETMSFGFMGDQIIKGKFEITVDLPINYYDLREMFGEKVEEDDIIEYLISTGVELEDIEQY